MDDGECRGRPIPRPNGAEGCDFYFCSDDDGRFSGRPDRKSSVHLPTPLIRRIEVLKRSHPSINLKPRIRPLKRLPEARSPCPTIGLSLLSFSSSSLHFPFPSSPSLFLCLNRIPSLFSLHEQIYHVGRLSCMVSLALISLRPSLPFLCLYHVTLPPSPEKDASCNLPLSKSPPSDRRPVGLRAVGCDNCR